MTPEHHALPPNHNGLLPPLMLRTQALPAVAHKWRSAVRRGHDGKSSNFGVGTTRLGPRLGGSVSGRVYRKPLGSRWLLYSRMVHRYSNESVLLGNPYSAAGLSKARQLACVAVDGDVGAVRVPRDGSWAEAGDTIQHAGGAGDPFTGTFSDASQVTPATAGHARRSMTPCNTAAMARAEALWASIAFSTASACS